MNKETLQQQIAEYRKEIEISTGNREKLIGMLNQQDVKIQQLLGAIAAIERILKEEAGNVGVESTSNPQGEVIS